MEQRMAGSELDLEIHSRIFGHRLLSEDEMRAEAEGVWATQPNCVYFLPGFTAYRDPVRFVQQCPRYSTDILAAFQVIDKWRERGEGFQLDSLGFRGEEWRCCFMDASDGGMRIEAAEADTAPLAICLAALAAVAATAMRRRG